jgi:stage III sporulation protein AH
MTMNKQTVWLVTMLTLMVALSAYYIVTGPVEPVQKSTQKMDEMMSKAKMDVEIKDDQQVSKQLGKEDYFINYHLQRDTLRSKLSEEYMKTLSDPEASPAAVKKAEKQVNQLMKSDQQESSLEELIRKEGFHDAVVIHHQPKVDIIVQSEKLTREQVVRLITLAGQHFRVDPVQVSVAYRT